MLGNSAKFIRLDILKLAARVGSERKGAHIAPSLSMVDILTVLFNRIIRPDDFFVLSKGHGGLAYYAALKEVGIITEKQLDSFETDGGDFPGQPSKSLENGIAFSSGSLGMGLAYACGLALAAKKRCNDSRIYVLLGDGELNEGSNWESIMFAKQQNLSNLVAIIDNNGMQSDGYSSEIISVNLEKTFSAFGWQTHICNGHSLAALEKTFSIFGEDMPIVILAKTIKGFGVSFMENNPAWHHNRLSDVQYKDALKEIDNNGV